MLAPKSSPLIILALFFFLLAACETDTPPPPGTIASVNGEHISLHAVQALMDSRSASMGIAARPSVSEMQRNYGQALATLIAHTLVRQDLAERGIIVSEEDLNQAIGQIEEDFGEENLEAYLADSFLRIDEWRQLMRDHVALETFIDRVLLPSIKINLDEIRAWYEENKEDLKTPANLRVCYAMESSRQGLEAWCATVAKEDFEPGPFAQCVDALPASLPDPWKTEKIKPGACGKFVEEAKQWRTMAVIKKNDARLPQLSEVYALGENILLEEKKLNAFDAWLKKKIASSKIVAAPGLFAPPKQKDADS